jgi:hypothetical protein
MLKVNALAATMLIVLSAVAHAGVLNVCNGGMCRTIVSGSDGSITWISDLWEQH